MDDALIEAIAALVHDAWADEKIRQGFADHAWKPVNRHATLTNGTWGALDLCAADGEVTELTRSNGSVVTLNGGSLCGIPRDRHHPDMLPYPALGEHIKEYDRVTVRAVLNALTAAGYEIVPLTPDTETHKERIWTRITPH